MVLVEVIKLIVHIDWSLHFGSNIAQWDIAVSLFLACLVVLRLQVSLAVFVVLNRQFKNLLAKHVEDDTNGQENDTENAESKHCTHCCWNWSPSGQCLLLELRLFEFLNLLTDPLLFFLIDVHLFLSKNENDK